MYLSSKKRFLFIHIEKAAGSSVRDTLAPYWDKRAPIDRLLKKLHLPYRRWRAIDQWPLHFHAKDAKASLPQKLWEQCFKFTFVRNPWDREVSTFRFYKSLLRLAPDDPRAVAANRHTTFEKWFYEWRQQQPVVQQCDYLMGDDGTFLLDFHGRFESIEEDWGLLQKNLGLAAPLQEANVVRPSGPKDREGYQAFYNPTLKLEVEKRYSKDCQLLGYDFKNTRIPATNPPR